MVKKINFKNKIFSKKELKQVIYEAFTEYGIARTYLLADEIKDLGFHYATKAGISISVEDLKVPPSKKELLLKSNNEIIKSDLAYSRGEINFVERFQKVIDIWNQTSETLKNNLVTYFSATDPLNSIYLMAFSGARGNLSQVRQLVGMRGLMSDPNGQIMDIPIIHNFREGLTVTDYIMSAYGARKGVVDTALRTADSGYLTRRLIDVAQDIIIREYDCYTKRSIKIYAKEANFYSEKIIGRTSAQTIISSDKKITIVRKGQIIDEKIKKDIISLKIKSIKINSPLTCESTRSICQKCYGWNLANCKLVKLGEAIGILAAQSIGEPGTQLTMRTFHTGGIFTSDVSRQIRAKSTGVFYISKTAQLKLNRTIYGSALNILEREDYFNIIDFKNVKSTVKLPADSSIYLMDKSFVKTGDLIAELPHKNQQTTKSRKKIIATHAGEVNISTKKNILWVLGGEVYDIPNNSLINYFSTNQKILTQDNLYQFKLQNQTDGFLKFNKNQFDKSIEGINIINCFEIFNSLPIFWDKKLSKLILLINLKTHYILNNFPSNHKANQFIFAKNIQTKYFTSLGGQIAFLNTSFFKNDPTYKKDIVKTTGKIFILPIETYTINKNKSLLLIENNTKLEDTKIELISGIFSKTNGFFQIKESNQIVEEIQIKPCVFLEFIELTDTEITYLKKCDKKIYYPGEIVFDDILIDRLSYIEFLKIRNSFVLLLRPINVYNVPKSKEYEKKVISQKRSPFKFKRVYCLNYKIDFKNDKPQKICLVDENIFFKTKLNIDEKIFSYKVINIKNYLETIETKNKVSIHSDFQTITSQKVKNKTIYSENKKKIFYLALVKEEKLNLINLVSKKLKTENFKLSLFIKNFEYVEKKNIIGKISFVPKNLQNLYKLKRQSNQNLKILLISKLNYQNYYSEINLFFFKKNQMIKVDDFILPLLKIKHSGKIIKRKPFQLTLHCGTPFYITQSTLIYQHSGALVKKDELLGIINFEQIVTGDIVQGLPKIEEILEARKPQNPAFLSEFPGIVVQAQTFKGKISNIISLYSNSNYDTCKNNKILENFRTLKISKPIIVKKNDYIYVGQALTEGSINPHNLLMTYFAYYKNFANDYESTYLSFKHIQMLLIQKIQQVYNSQGVSIADKHLEVIIKHITSRVQIYKPGSSLLLPGEIIELQQITYINTILKKSKKDIAIYYPILMGITKASLLSDSFISAASFQETTKILTAAAIEGKIDWLRGLKENVIIGRLIPVGTGFRNELNLSKN